MWKVDLGATYTIRQIVLHLPQADDERSRYTETCR